MKITDTIFASCYCTYKNNEFTTEYGNIIFDRTKSGSTNNCYLYSLGIHSYGHINFYIDKNTRTLNSIRFIDAKSDILFIDNKLESLCFENSLHEIPFFDLSEFEKYDKNDNDGYLTIEVEKPIEVSHDKDNRVQFLFGEIHYKIRLNNSLVIYVDTENNLSGLLVMGENINTLVRQLVET